ncbi:MAG: class I SAM-dependent methyltransferase [Methanomassiliicoccaceae archaeon]|nr:class I SAM-dependent methyltransferase [Methanomassiliicoccaceae archaeon]
MTVLRQKDAWNELYSSQFRPWRGVITIDTPLPFAEGNKIIDIGCGTGKTSFALMEAKFNVTGIDTSDVAVGICEKLYGDRMQTIVASASKIPTEDETFDGAVMVHVLEHMEDDESEKAMKELYRILKHDAKIFVRVFHRDDMRSDKGEVIGEGTVLRGNGIMYHYFTEAELKRLFKDFNLVSLQKVDERTKFAGKRSRIDAVFQKTD